MDPLVPGNTPEPESRAPLILRPLRERDFALLFTGTTVSMLGDGIYLVAIAWQVYAISMFPPRSAWSESPGPCRWSCCCSSAAFWATGSSAGDC